MESAGWWVGLGGVLTAIGTGVAWVLTWYVQQYRKQQMAEVQTLNLERRTDEQTGYQRLSDLFDSQQVRLRKQGRGIAKLRRRCNEAEKREIRCIEQLASLQSQVTELKDGMMTSQNQQVKLLAEQRSQLDILIGEAQAQTALQTDSALDKILDVATPHPIVSAKVTIRESKPDPDDTTRGK